MKVNENVHYTPDEPDKCTPTSHVVCTYCRSQNKCSRKMPFEPYTVTSDTNVTVSKPTQTNNLFDE